MKYSAEKGHNYRKLKEAKHEHANRENVYLSLDEALEFVGDNSRYQKRVIYIFSVQWALFAFLTMGLPLLLVKPALFCYRNGEYERCYEDDACQNPFYIDKEKSDSSIPFSFDLYCDRAYLINWISSLFFFGKIHFLDSYEGTFAAGFIFPYIADRKGRRFTILLTVILSGISLLLCGLSPNIDVLLIAITIAGVAASGFETLIYVYTSEVSGGRFRNFSVVTLGFVWAVAQVLTSPLFYIVSEWRAIIIASMAIPFIVSLIPTYFFIFETPRYLVSKKQFFAARDVIKRMCVVNLRPIFQPRLLNELEDLNNRVTLIYPPRHTNETKDEGTKGYIDLFTEPELRRTTILLLYIWFFRNITYFGLNYSLPVLGEAIYTNFTVAAISEAIANLVAAPLKLKFGRVKLLNLFSVFVTISCLMVVFFPIPKDCYEEEAECYQKFFAVGFSVISKFGIAVFANILITYTSEAYPTEVRTVGMFLTMQSSRVGTVVMPFFIGYFQEREINPLVCFGIMGILACCMIFCLPETLGSRMKDFVTELKEIEKPLIQMTPRKESMEFNIE